MEFNGLNNNDLNMDDLKYAEVLQINQIGIIKRNVIDDGETFQY